MRRYGDAGPAPKGTVMTGTFILDGQEFYAWALLTGKLGPDRDSEAVHWLTRASEQDNANARYEPGMHLEQSGEEAPPGMGAADW